MVSELLDVEQALVELICDVAMDQCWLIDLEWMKQLVDGSGMILCSEDIPQWFVTGYHIEWRLIELNDP